MPQGPPGLDLMQALVAILPVKVVEDLMAELMHNGFLDVDQALVGG